MALKEKLREDLLIVGNEIGYVWMHHEIFWKVINIINNNERVRELGGDLVNWIRNAYIEAGSVGLRKQLDRDSRSISMMNILVALQQNHTHFTREGFQKLMTFIPGHMLHKPSSWEAAGQEFDQLFGNGYDHLDDKIVASEIDMLERISWSVKEQVNKDCTSRQKRNDRT